MRKIILITLILLLIGGCGTKSNEFNDSKTFIGKSKNWTAEIKFTYNDKFVPAGKGYYIRKTSSNHKNYIKFIGKGVVKTLEFKCTWNNSSSSFSGSDNFERKPYIIGGGGSSDSSSAKMSENYLKTLKLGGFNTNYPNEDNDVVLNLKWDGKEETLKLKKQ